MNEEPIVNSSTPGEFWLVWTKTGPYPPRKTYHSQTEAHRVAEVMARKFPDKRWFVLLAVERLCVNEAEDHRPQQSEAA